MRNTDESDTVRVQKTLTNDSRYGNNYIWLKNNNKYVQHLLITKPVQKIVAGV